MSEELLTLREAEQRVSMKNDRGRNLQRYLLAKERERRREIMVRMRGSRRVHYRVTMALLRRWCPELFADSSVDKLRRQIPGLVQLIDHRAHRVFDVRFDRDVRPRLKELFDRDETVANSVRQIGGAPGGRKPL